MVLRTTSGVTKPVHANGFLSASYSYVVLSHAITLVSLLLACQIGMCQGLSHAWHGEKKLILVTTADWDATEGTLIRYERKPLVADGRQQGWNWEQVSDPIAVVIGRSGLAWDPKLGREHPDLYRGPVKHEGDGRSPAGVFQLQGGTFGFAPDLPGSRTYMQLTPSIECVDDETSSHYGQIVDRLQVERVDWNSSEKMRSVANYRWGVVVSYNTDKPVRGDGSCIFLHQWSGPTSTTAGCTAMSADDIEKIVHWVTGDVRAVLVELPKSEYQRLRNPWQLP